MDDTTKDPVHISIMQSKHALVENVGFDPVEAIDASVDERKFLIPRLLKDCEFVDEEIDDD